MAVDHTAWWMVDSVAEQIVSYQWQPFGTAKMDNSRAGSRRDSLIASHPVVITLEISNQKRSIIFWKRKFHPQLMHEKRGEVRSTRSDSCNHSIWILFSELSSLHSIDEMEFASSRFSLESQWAAVSAEEERDHLPVVRRVCASRQCTMRRLHDEACKDLRKRLAKCEEAAILWRSCEDGTITSILTPFSLRSLAFWRAPWVELLSNPDFELFKFENQFWFRLTSTGLNRRIPRILLVGVWRAVRVGAEWWLSASIVRELVQGGRTFNWKSEFVSNWYAID